MSDIKILEPRYHDSVALIGAHHVSPGNNRIYITKGAYAGVYGLTGDEIKSYHLGTNGKIPCYEVPLSVLAGRRVG